MKKLFFAAAVLFGSFGFYACGGDEGITETEDATVIERDTTVSEIEVERTTMDIDTTIDTESETIELENEQ
ncbi:hypothetical protein ACFSRY_05485 [Pontibacter locisalis]|uniref:Uncharacterized protein n=1 Tax=Pontibacter locisalis TaxID=1719035 RepID=A0ABW5IK05_9BACT